jgi:hypothetical protein
MAEQAQVKSVEALEALRSAFIQYQAKARRASIKAAIQEILSSLQGDARLESLSPLLAEWIELDAPAAAAWAAVVRTSSSRASSCFDLTLNTARCTAFSSPLTSWRWRESSTWSSCKHGSVSSLSSVAKTFSE